MSYWQGLTDEELEQRLKEERRRTWQTPTKKERAIAWANVRAIEKEQVRRYELRFGLE